MTTKYATCPICNGTKRVTPDVASRPYVDIIAGYDKLSDTLACINCGGQYQFGKSTGKVPLRRDNGEPCVHKYVGENISRCYYGYTCIYCGDYYTIDSGD